MSVEKFINLVKREKCIWDETETSYYLRMYQTRAWIRIAQTMTMSVDDAKKWWQLLRDNFLEEQEWKKQCKASGEYKEIKYPYSNMMGFLLETESSGMRKREVKASLHRFSRNYHTGRFETGYITSDGRYVVDDPVYTVRENRITSRQSKGSQVKQETQTSVPGRYKVKPEHNITVRCTSVEEEELSATTLARHRGVAPRRDTYTDPAPTRRNVTNKPSPTRRYPSPTDAS
ncbi:uncharacterized protein LOC142986311 isoform X2 [Anticarsia gemmatalis]|uniref:uncharacterized protein LOC142986311 isoform X2 n=1 Tax=Anticarsia gemmatalis TaxID=129554 RepID=UPI003F768C5C